MNTVHSHSFLAWCFSPLSFKVWLFFFFGFLVFGVCFLLFFWLCQVLVAALRIFTAALEPPSCGAWTQELHEKAYLLGSMRTLVLWRAIEPESPEVQGGFLTTGLPGKTVRLFPLVWTIFTVAIEFVTLALLLYVSVFWPWGTWGLSPLPWKAKS